MRLEFSHCYNCEKDADRNCTRCHISVCSDCSRLSVAATIQHRFDEGGRYNSLPKVDSKWQCTACDQEELSEAYKQLAKDDKHNPPNPNSRYPFL